MRGVGWLHDADPARSRQPRQRRCQGIECQGVDLCDEPGYPERFPVAQIRRVPGKPPGLVGTATGCDTLGRTTFYQDDPPIDKPGVKNMTTPTAPEGSSGDQPTYVDPITGSP